MDKLEEGKSYELVVTNNSGLYRYRMRDVMFVAGFHNATPMVEFLYRTDRTVSLMGEKTILGGNDRLDTAALFGSECETVCVFETLAFQ